MIGVASRARRRHRRWNESCRPVPRRADRLLLHQPVEELAVSTLRGNSDTLPIVRTPLGEEGERLVGRLTQGELTEHACNHQAGAALSRLAVHRHDVIAAERKRGRRVSWNSIELWLGVDSNCTASHEPNPHPTPPRAISLPALHPTPHHPTLPRPTITLCYMGSSHVAV